MSQNLRQRIEELWESGELEAGPIEEIVSDFRAPARFGPAPPVRAFAGPSPAVSGPPG